MAAKCDGKALRKLIYGDEDTPITDHLKNTYPSFTAMCKAHGVQFRTFRQRISRGWSLKDALLPLSSENSPKDWQKAQACADSGLTCMAYDRRVRRGWSPEDALAKPPHDNGQKKGVYYKGKYYESHNALYAAYGTSKNTVMERKKKGWTPEECIEGKKNADAYEDPFGYEHPSKYAMCGFYHISPGAAFNAKERGHDMGNYLIWMPTEPVKLSEGFTVTQWVGGIYYGVLLGDEEDTWTLHELFQYINDNGIPFTRSMGHPRRKLTKKIGAE